MTPAGDSSRCIPAMSATVQDELLLLTLQLLQPLQQLREATSTSSSTTPASHRAMHAPLQPRRSFASAEDRARYLINTESDAVEVLLTLAELVPMSNPAQSSAVASGCGPGYAVSDVFTQQASAIFAICESHLRAHGVHPSRLVNAVERVAGCLCICSNSQPNLLLRLARWGSSVQQQVAFFNLLMTLLKLSVTPPFSVNTPAGSRCRSVVAATAVNMLHVSLNGSNTAAAAAVAAANEAIRSSYCSSSTAKGVSSSDTSRVLSSWLLLLGRCFLQWAADLEQLQAAGADWAQLIRQAQQQRGQEGGVLGMSMGSLTSLCFATQQPRLLELVCGSMKLLRLEEGSSSAAALAATGYDHGLDTVLQAFEALAACYPAVLMAYGPGDAVAARVAGLISALEAVGKACSVFAVPYCCNNPGCDNLAGASELVIVSGKGKGCICGGCKVARYCGKVCQQAHLKQHKPTCKMLCAAAAATQHS